LHRNDINDMDAATTQQYYDTVVFPSIRRKDGVGTPDFQQYEDAMERNSGSVPILAKLNAQFRNELNTDGSHFSMNGVVAKVLAASKVDPQHGGFMDLGCGPFATGMESMLCGLKNCVGVEIVKPVYRKIQEDVSIVASSEPGIEMVDKMTVQIVESIRRRALRSNFIDDEDNDLDDDGSKSFAGRSPPKARKESDDDGDEDNESDEVGSGSSSVADGTRPKRGQRKKPKADDETAAAAKSLAATNDKIAAAKGNVDHRKKQFAEAEEMLRKVECSLDPSCLNSFPRPHYYHRTFI
jgi:hypothetical protein